MNEIKVLGISGKKQSGKDTTANYIVGVFLKALKITEDFHISDQGNLIVTDIFGNKEYAGVLDMDSRHPEFVKFAEENIYPFIKLYSYADLLKQHVCMDVLGLDWSQCYGTDEEKNTETMLKWENMPGYEEFIRMKSNIPTGYMTAREVMQFVGTEIFRKMYGDVWALGTIRKIAADAPTLALICDIRFENEVEIVSELNHMEKVVHMKGKIIRLTRDVFKGKDQHDSETALDDFNWDKNECFTVVNNENMSISEQNKAIHDLLAKEQWLPHEIPSELLERLPSE